MTLSRRIEKLEDGTRGGRPTGEAGWICPHRIDAYALSNLSPEATGEIRRTYHVPEGAPLDWTDDEETPGAVTVWAYNMTPAMWKDSGSLVMHPVPEPAAPSLDLSAVDRWRLRWLRFDAHVLHRTRNVGPARWEEDRITSAVARAVDEIPWLGAVVEWYDAVPVVDLSSYAPELVPDRINPPPDPPGETWKEVAEAVKERRANLNPYAIEKYRRGTPEEADALQVARYYARTAHAVNTAPVRAPETP